MGRQQRAKSFKFGNDKSHYIFQMKENDSLNRQNQPDNASSLSKNEPLNQSKQNEGKWTQEENAMYVAYLQFHRDKFKNKDMRRANKFYKEMSRFIQTRSSLQCRSHHQKLQTKYRYLNRIISDYKRSHDPLLYQRYKEQLLANQTQTSIGSQKSSQSPPALSQAEVQTDLAGLNLQFVFAEDFQKNEREKLLVGSAPQKNQQRRPEESPSTIFGRCLLFPASNHH